MKTSQSFLGGLSIGAAILAASAHAHAAAAKPETSTSTQPSSAAPAIRPNILFCLADDWMWPHASALGARGVKTPAFDRVVREGVLFENAHAAAPSCSPSRAAILTGRHVWELEHGSALLGFLPEKFPVYPALLERAGYHVGYCGKGYSPGGIKGAPRNPAGPAYADFAAFLKKRPAGAPFCFWLGSHYPHRPYKRGIGLAAGKSPADAAPPVYLPDTREVREDILDYFAEVDAFDRQVADALALLEKNGELDNTLIIVTGDNGWPFPRAKATCYDAGTHQALAIRWAGAVRGGRRVSDFVSLADLCPTILEAAGVPVPGGVSARSLLNVLKSGREGWVDPARDHVLTAMETHVPARDLGSGRMGGYPMRALITRDFHYIRNFAPERWPAGDPAPGMFASASANASAPAPAMDFAALATKTQTAFADVDASPSKAVMVLRRDEPGVRPLFRLAFEHRPARELYDRRADPGQLRNLAEDPAYAETVAKLDAMLMRELAATDDPRAHGGGAQFDDYSINPPGWQKAAAKGNAAGKGKGAGKKSAAKPAEKKKTPFVTTDPNGGWAEGGYYIHNNMWNSAKYPPCESTLTAWSHDNWQVVTRMNNNTRDGAVKTYPNVHKDFRAAPIDSFASITSAFAATSPGVGIYNVAYDIWINGIAKSGHTELMIWTDNRKQAPSGRHMEDATFSGRTFKVYKTTTGAYIALVAAENFSAGKLDLLEIMNWLAAKGWIPANSTLSQICFGIEMVSTDDEAAKFQVTAFSIDAKAKAKP